MIYFWLLLLAHSMADFLFQTDLISSAKCKNQWQGYALHGLAVFVCTLIALHFFGWISALTAAGTVTVIHLLVDWLKNMGRNLRARVLKKELRPGVPGLLLDQSLHIFTLFWVWYILDRPVHTAMSGFYSAVLRPVNILVQGWSMEKVVPVLTIYVLVAIGGAVLVRMSLDQLFPGGEPRPGKSKETPETTDENKRISAGKYIGILERLLILTLATTGNISAIGFVFAAKSIARYSELSNKQFAEYYLVGTLTSFFLALVGGMALRLIL